MKSTIMNQKNIKTQGQNYNTKHKMCTWKNLENLNGEGIGGGLVEVLLSPLEELLAISDLC